MDLAPLYDAVIANPNDEGARLAYANAVRATDPARAELVELQLQLAKWRSERRSPPEATPLYNRQHALRTAHGDRWAADVRDLASRWMFRRGFVEEVTLDARTFLARAPELYRRAPILHLTLTGAKPVVPALFGSPYLDRIRSLSLARNDLGDAEVATLAGSPHLAAMRWLDLSDNPVGQAGLEALAASPHLPALQYLGFADTAIPDPTPAHRDEYDADSAVAKQLVTKYGARPWLSAAPPRAEWPPDRDAV
ncbi:MAG: hypothetical protein WKG01_19330 [Kofleriaceae bacterium]